jgi:Tol biopolymer transport system component
MQQQSQLYPLALPDRKNVIFTRWWGAASTARLGAVRVGENRYVDLGIQSVGAIAYFDGLLVYRAADGNVLAVPFDPESLKPTGTPVTVLTALRQLGGAADGRAAAALTTNGTLIYQTGKLLYDLILINREKDSVLLSRQASLTNPRMSPDGRRIAVTRRAAEGNDVWIYNMAGATVQRLTTEGQQNDRAEWSPDGSRVLFRSDRGGSFRLWSQPVGGGEARLEVDRQGKDIWEGIYSPDGQSILFRTGTLASADVWSTPVGRSTTDTPVATSKFQEAAARVSPNGEWILYTSYQSGGAEVYVARYPSMQDPLQVSDGGSDGVWGDDRTLYYSTSSGITRVDLTGGTDRAVLKRTPVVRRELSEGGGHATFDVTRDGQLLVVALSESDTRTIVAHGWQHELRRKLAASGGGAK